METKARKGNEVPANNPAMQEQTLSEAEMNTKAQARQNIARTLYKMYMFLGCLLIVVGLIALFGKMIYLGLVGCSVGAILCAMGAMFENISERLKMLGI